MTYAQSRAVRFDRPRPLTDYLDDAGAAIPGHELGGLALPPHALAALADSKVTRQPCELVVTGEEWGSDGRHFLLFGVSRDYIEATTDYRHVKVDDNDRGALRWVCPDCRERSGKHSKLCPRA